MNIPIISNFIANNFVMQSKMFNAQKVDHIFYKADFKSWQYLVPKVDCCKIRKTHK